MEVERREIEKGEESAQEQAVPSAAEQDASSKAKEEMAVVSKLPSTLSNTCTISFRTIITIVIIVTTIMCLVLLPVIMLQPLFCPGLALSLYAADGSHRR
tara:strand:+ start:322 stop:621 length:300 start_codon:yes stop_codon:yes gene_type:complete